MNPTPEQWARLKQLFDEAKVLSLPARTACLARVRGDEGEAMAEQLEALLKAHDEKTTPADEPLVPFLMMECLRTRSDCSISRAQRPHSFKVLEWASSGRLEGGVSDETAYFTD
jgi:hypothetical protein